MKFKKRSDKGFTLLELLVVIAIIGILAAVVMAAVSSAKIKGNDSSISSIMSSMRSQAALYQAAVGNFASIGAATTAAHCTAANTLFGASANPNLVNLLTDLARKNGATLGSVTPGGKNIVCSTTNNPATIWAVVASTSGSDTINWCADSSGASKAVSGTGLIDTATGLCK